MKELPVNTSLTETVQTRLVEATTALERIQIELEQIQCTLEEEPEKLTWGDAGSLYHITELLEEVVVFVGGELEQ